MEYSITLLEVDMKMLSIILAVFGALLSLGPSALYCSQAIQGTSSSVPEYVIYDFYFRRLAYIEELAHKNEQAGLTGDKLRSTIKNELGINDSQYSLLLLISTHSLTKVRTLDAKIKEIILNGYSNRAEKINEGINPNNDPALVSLQMERNDVFLNAKAELSQRLGIQKFQNVDSRIKTFTLPNVNATKPR
jgi:hypothetical protein